MALESGLEVKEFYLLVGSDLEFAMSFHDVNEPQLVKVPCFFLAVGLWILP